MFLTSFFMSSVLLLEQHKPRTNFYSFGSSLEVRQIPCIFTVTQAQIANVLFASVLVFWSVFSLTFVQETYLQTIPKRIAKKLRSEADCSEYRTQDWCRLRSDLYYFGSELCVYHHVV